VKTLEAASSELFRQAATLMLVGMVFVYGFLSLLIIIIKFLISPIASRYPDTVSQPTKNPAANVTMNGHPASVVTAITVAIDRYRNKHR